MKKKNPAIFKIFKTKGQHNDELSSVEKTANAEAKLKKLEINVSGKESLEINKSQTDISTPNSVASVPHNKESLKATTDVRSPRSKSSLKRILLHKGTIPAAIILSCIGAVCLFYAYLQSSLIFTFTGLGLTLWGTLLFYVTPTRQIPAELIGSFSLSMQKSINDLIRLTGYTGDAIFFHPKTLAGFGQGYLFIFHYSYKAGQSIDSKLDALNRLSYRNEMRVPSLYIDTSGLFLAAPSQGLVDLFEEKLRVNLATVDIVFVQEKLSKLLIEDLKLLDSFLIERQNNGSVVLMMSGGPFTDMCKRTSRESDVGNHIDCPICSAIALVISKISSKPVNIKENAISDDTVQTTFSELSF